MADKNVKDTDIVERLRRLEERVLPDGVNPAESVSGQQLADVLQGEGDEQPSFDAVDIKNGALVGGSEVVTQDSGVPQHSLGDGTVHSDATLAELNSRVSDAALRGEADFYDTDAGSIYAASFATASDVPTPLSVGTIVHVEDEDQLYQQKAAGFEKVSPKRDIAFKDKAETFVETNASINVEGGYVNNESVVMAPEPETVSWNLSTDGGNITETVGTIDTTPYDTLGGTYTYQKESLGTGYLNIDFNGVDISDTLPGEDVDISGLEGEYDIVVTLDDEYSNGDPATTTGELSTNGPATLTNAFIGWPQPDDIYRWDAATFQATLDNESVDVYVEESTDGGSTWTEIDGPINRGDMITAAANSEVRFRVELARADTANNPTLDSIYRRYVV